MKMNKLVKGLLVGFIALQMVGCEEAKEVENLNIQDTQPVVEEVENLCHWCHEDEPTKVRGGVNVCDFCDNYTAIELDKLNINLYYKDLKSKFNFDELIYLFTYEPNGVVEACKEMDWLEILTPVDMACYLCHLIEEDTGANIPTVFNVGCCEYCRKDIVDCICKTTIHFADDRVSKKDIMEAPTAMTAEEFANAKCENCGHDVSDVIDNAGGYWCEACDYVK